MDARSCARSTAQPDHPPTSHPRILILILKAVVEFCTDALFGVFGVVYAVEVLSRLRLLIIFPFRLLYLFNYFFEVFFYHEGFEAAQRRRNLAVDPQVRHECDHC